MELWTVLGDIVVLLVACLILGGGFSKIGQSPLLGYLIAGMFLGGPGGLGIVSSQHQIEAIAELGVALLLFSLGLEFSFERLRGLGSRPLTAGLLQVVITAALASLAAYLFGMQLKASLALGAMVTLSSTAVVLRTLMERGELEMPHGRNCLAVLLVQDIMVVPLAIFISILGKDGSTSEVLLEIAEVLLYSAALVLGLFFLTKLADRALKTLTLVRNRELTVVFAVVTGLGSAHLAHSAGLSPALGAFVAGMLLGSSAFSVQIRADISSLRVVLLTLFFGAAGMVANPEWILGNLQLVLGVTLLIFLVKFLLVWLLFQLLGQTLRVSSTTAVCLAQVGEFAFVLGSIGLKNGVVSEDLYVLVVSVTILSFILSAFLLPSAPRIGNYLSYILGGKAKEPQSLRLGDCAPEVLIVGFGPAGELASRDLVDSDRSTLVLDLNLDGVKRAKALGFYAEVGDATQRDVLEHIPLGELRAALITIPDHRSSLIILEHIRTLAPHADMIVRSRHQMHSDSFFSSGAHRVVGDEEQVGRSLSMELKESLDSSGRGLEREVL